MSSFSTEKDTVVFYKWRLLQNHENRFHEYCLIPNSMHAPVCCHSGRTHTFGVQTLPSVTAAGLHFINGICTGIRSILLFVSLSGCTAEIAHSLRAAAFAPFTSHIPLCQAAGGISAASPLPTDKVRCMSGHKKNSEWRGKGKIFKSILWYGSLEELREGS